MLGLAVASLRDRVPVTSPLPKKIPLSPTTTVYTDLNPNCKFTDLAPLTPQFWGGSEFKVPQNWGI